MAIYLCQFDCLFWNKRLPWSSSSSFSMMSCTSSVSASTSATISSSASERLSTVTRFEAEEDGVVEKGEEEEAPSTRTPVGDAARATRKTKEAAEIIFGDGTEKTKPANSSLNSQVELTNWQLGRAGAWRSGAKCEETTTTRTGKYPADE